LRPIKKIEMPISWVIDINIQMDKWEIEERMNLKINSQKFEISIIEIQNRLDKLVNGFLEGIIERGTYLQKKEEYVLSKIDLEQKRKELLKRGCFWIEPMREWLKACIDEEKIVASTEFLEKKSLDLFHNL
jgi:hypothetical protein